MQALCPRCGMPSEGGLCKSCALETTKIFSCPDQVEVVICSVCGSQHVKGRWLQPDDRDEEEMAASAAADAVWLHRDLAGADIDVDLKRWGPHATWLQSTSPAASRASPFPCNAVSP